MMIILRCRYLFVGPPLMLMRGAYFRSLIPDSSRSGGRQAGRQADNKRVKWSAGHNHLNSIELGRPLSWSVAACSEPASESRTFDCPSGRGSGSYPWRFLSGRRSVGLFLERASGMPTSRHGMDQIHLIRSLLLACLWPALTSLIPRSLIHQFACEVWRANQILGKRASEESSLLWSAAGSS